MTAASRRLLRNRRPRPGLPFTPSRTIFGLQAKKDRLGPESEATARFFFFFLALFFLYLSGSEGNSSLLPHLEGPPVAHQKASDSPAASFSIKRRSPTTLFSSTAPLHSPSLLFWFGRCWCWLAHSPEKEATYLSAQHGSASSGLALITSPHCRKSFTRPPRATCPRNAQERHLTFPSVPPEVFATTPPPTGLHRRLINSTQLYLPGSNCHLEPATDPGASFDDPPL